MKKYLIIFSIFTAFILLGASCVNATDIDDYDPLMLENGEIEVSQENDINLTYDNAILKNNENYASQARTDFNEDLQGETAKDLGSAGNKLILNNTANELAVQEINLF